MAIRESSISDFWRDEAGIDQPPAPPGIPQGLVTVALNGAARLTWLPVNGATGYNVYWSQNSGVNPLTGNKIPGATSPNLQIGLTNGQTIYYVVTAVGLGGEGLPSAQVSVVPSSSAVPAQPLAVALIPGDTEMTINWGLSAGATSYNIYWSLTAGVTPGNGTLIGNISTPPYVQQNLVNGDPVYYVLTAINTNGASAPSAEVFDVVGVPVGNKRKESTIVDYWRLNAEALLPPSGTVPTGPFLPQPSISIPLPLALTGAIGNTTLRYALADHVHAHGNMPTGGLLHALATSSDPGFLPAIGNAPAFASLLVVNGVPTWQSLLTPDQLGALAGSFGSPSAANPFVTTSDPRFAADVLGPASAISGNLPSFNGTTGKLIQDSGVAAANVATLSGTQTITGAKTFTVPPTMSGANIGAGTVANAALANAAVALLSGTNSGDITVGTFGTSPTAKGLSLSAQALTLQPFSTSFPGAVPAPLSSVGKFLRDDGTWATAVGTTYTAGTGLTLTGTAFSLTTPVAVANGGTGSTSKNFVDLTTAQAAIGGAKTFTGLATFSGGIESNTGNINIDSGVMAFNGGNQSISFGTTAINGIGIGVFNTQSLYISSGFGDNFLNFDTTTTGSPRLWLGPSVLLDFNGATTANLVDPTTAQQAATKHYVDAQVGTIPAYTAGTGLTLTGSQFKLTTPVAVVNGGTGSATQNFVDLTTGQTVAGTKTFSSAPVMSGASIGSATIPLASLAAGVVDLTSVQSIGGAKTFTVAPNFSAQRLTNVADPTAAQDAATRAYVLAQIATIPAYTAGTGLTLTGSQFSLSAGAALANIGAAGITSTYLAAGVAAANLGYTPAHAAANSDITSLTGLTTPLSVTQGGTGSGSQNFIDLTTVQTAAGAKTWSDIASFGSDVHFAGGTTWLLNGNASVGNTINFGWVGNNVNALRISSNVNHITFDNLNNKTIFNAPTLFNATIDAGGLEITDAADPTAAQNVATKHYVDTFTVLPKTAGYALLSTDSGKVLTNTAAAGTVIFTLPAATLGLTYSFSVEAAFILEILAVGTDVLRIGATTSAAAGNLQSSVVGSTLVLVCTRAGFWTTMGGISGTWTVN